jgi:hypothetical protein
MLSLYRLRIEEEPMKLLTLSCLAILGLSFAAGSMPLSPNAVWQGSPQASPGSPWTLQIVSSNASGTRLTLDCPGFWSQSVLQEGQIRTQVQLVDPQSQGKKSGATALPGFPDLPALGRLLVIPNDKAVEIIVHEVTLQAFPCESPFMTEGEDGQVVVSALSDETYPAAWARSSTPGIMKDYRVAPVSFYPLRYDPVTHELLLATHLEIEVRTSTGSTENVKTFFSSPSQAFEPLYQDVIDNLNQYNSASPLVSEGHRGKYMIVTPNVYLDDAALINFANWKRQLGYTVVFDTLFAVTADSQIKTAIQAQYFAGDQPLDYVLLLSDDYGGQNPNPLSIPSWSFKKPGEGEYDPTDHPYTLLEGNDYFPDVLLGRISVRNSQQLQIVLAKILNYEKTAFTPNNDWYKSALVSAGNRSDTPPAPITPAWSSLWLRDKLLDYGYTRVDTVIWWGNPQSYSEGTTRIANSINQGVGIVAYRGWGNATGWLAPYFFNSHVEQLINGAMTPVVVSIVCWTANFAVADACFGEDWLRFGSSSGIKGGVGFYGPTELHTKTNWNNAIYAGFFEGLLEENLYRFGQAVVRSKLETYYGFPDFIAHQDFVEFYFHVYTTLGDPEMPIWTDIPAIITVDAPGQVLPGNQQVTVTAKRADGSPLGGAYVGLYKASDNLLTGGVTNGNGVATIEIEPLTAGPITVTVSKQNCKPLQDTINVELNNFPVGMTGLAVDGDGVAQAGETVQMTVTVKNFGADPLTDVVAILSENDPYVTLGPATVNLGTIAGLEQVPAAYPVTLAPGTPNSHAVEFTLNLSNTQYTAQAKFLLPVGGLQMIPVTLVTDSGSVAPGHTAKLRPLILNIGLIPAQGLTGTLSCQYNVVTVSSGSVSFPVVQPGATALAGGAFTVQVASSTFPGRQVILNLALTASGGFTQSVNYPVQLGTAASSDPLGPDPYGYYAYDNTDVGYTEAPAYQWIELDPRHGGSNADLILLGDDTNHTLHLPFTFNYYGLSFDTLTICSNGFVNFGSSQSWASDFRNWNIPSSLGPPSLIAAFWDDLRSDTLDGDNWIHVLSRYDQAAGQFVVEWSRTVNDYLYEDSNQWKEETFELVLFDPVAHPTLTGDGEILLQYLVVNDVDNKENFCTVGMEDEAHQRGLQYSFSHNLPSSAAPLVTGRAIKFTTDAPTTTLAAREPVIPTTLSFGSPSPNPANPGTVLTFRLPAAGRVHVDLYDLMGRKAATLLDADLTAGSHNLPVNGAALANGMYFAVLRYDGQALTQKILILK